MSPSLTNHERDALQEARAEIAGRVDEAFGGVPPGRGAGGFGRGLSGAQTAKAAV